MGGNALGAAKLLVLRGRLLHTRRAHIRRRVLLPPSFAVIEAVFALVAVDAGEAAGALATARLLDALRGVTAAARAAARLLHRRHRRGGRRRPLARDRRRLVGQRQSVPRDVGLILAHAQHALAPERARAAELWLVEAVLARITVGHPAARALAAARPADALVRAGR